MLVRSYSSAHYIEFGESQKRPRGRWRTVIRGQCGTFLHYVPRVGLLSRSMPCLDPSRSNALVCVFAFAISAAACSNTPAPRISNRSYRNDAGTETPTDSGGRDSSIRRDGSSEAGAQGDGGNTMQDARINPGDGGTPPMDTGSATRTVRSGSISVTQFASGNYPQVSFTVATVANVSDGCTTRMVDSCNVMTCPGPIADAGVPTGDGGLPGPRNVQAGTVTLMSGSQMVTLTPTAMDTYMSTFGTSALWADGAEVVFRATGADGGVPAFMGMVNGPPVTIVTAPTIPGPPAKLGIPVASPLAFTWTGSAAGTRITVQLSETPVIGMTTTSLTCDFSPAALSASIPAGAMTGMTGGGYLSLSVSGSATVRAGDYDVTLTASISPVSAAIDFM